MWRNVVVNVFFGVCVIHLNERQKDTHRPFLRLIRSVNLRLTLLLLLPPLGSGTLTHHWLPRS